MLLNDIKPSSFLTEFIRLYRIIDFQFPHTATIPFKAYSPRPEHCLQFYPKDCETVKDPYSDHVVAGKKTSVIGQHTNVIHRYVGREFLSFQVIFQPGALFHITGIPSDELTNVYMDAEDIFGSHIRLVNEQLFHARSYAEMVSTVEYFLICLIRSCKKRQHPIDAIGKVMLHQKDVFSLDKYIKEACLSHRQFDRKFKERIGIAPKQFLQIIRFDQAFRMKNRFLHKDWLSIAIHCGYHDYQHLSKDFKEFTGNTPTRFFEMENGSPERVFGDAET
jgi:AraC-like DNA-binding protein